MKVCFILLFLFIKFLLDRICKFWSLGLMEFLFGSLFKVVLLKNVLIFLKGCEVLFFECFIILLCGKCLGWFWVLLKLKIILLFWCWILLLICWWFMFIKCDCGVWFCVFKGIMLWSGLIGIGWLIKILLNWWEWVFRYVESLLFWIVFCLRGIGLIEMLCCFVRWIWESREGWWWRIMGLKMKWLEVVI